MAKNKSPRLLREKAGILDRTLTSLYGRQEIESAENPLDTLIETILSQNTTDKNSSRAFAALKKAYSKWDSMLVEPVGRVALIIRSGGLAGIKAQRILDALRFIKEERGALDLEFLRGMHPAEAEAWLGQMKGVGPKTRSIVLLFSLGMPAFPVDTHIHRVTKRLGLIGPRTTREQAQEELALLVPPKEFFNFHINIIEHGRAICRARNPMCAKCAVSSMCDYCRHLRKAQS